MLCQKCGENQATTYYMQTINGKTTSIQLCSACAADIGVGSMLNHASMSDMFSEFLTNTFSMPSVTTNKVCEKCHSGLSDIIKSGKVGCDECYHTFYKEILPTIENVHGKTRHIGKISASADSRIKKKAEIQQLKSELNEAVENQEFETAAELRDRIKSIESELNQ